MKQQAPTQPSAKHVSHVGRGVEGSSALELTSGQSDEKELRMLKFEQLKDRKAKEAEQRKQVAVTPYYIVCEYTLISV